jgi:hypothetical protein
MIGSVDGRKISHVKKRVFLAAFSCSGSLCRAGDRAKVDLQNHYQWLRDDSWYLKAYRQAVIEAADSLQDKLTEMAFDGNIKVAVLLLKDLRAEEARDQKEQTNLLASDWSKLTFAQREILLNHYVSRELGTDDPKVIESAKREMAARAHRDEHDRVG